MQSVSPEGLLLMRVSTSNNRQTFVYRGQSEIAARSTSRSVAIDPS
jgi:hypothetical protein